MLNGKQKAINERARCLQLSATHGRNGGYRKMLGLHTTEHLDEKALAHGRLQKADLEVSNEALLDSLLPSGDYGIEQSLMLSSASKRAVAFLEQEKRIWLT
jgi:hypothetical protein